MKKFLILSCMLVSISSPLYCAQTTQSNTVNTQNIQEDLLEDDSKKPDYALDYTQFGLETPNYDEQAVVDKINKKATQIVEVSASGVEYIAIFAGLISLVMIMFGVFSKGLKTVGGGILILLLDLVIYSVVGNWPLVFEAFKSFLMS